MINIINNTMLSSLINVQYCYTYLIDQTPISLLLYSHIPTAVIALLFSVYVLIKRKDRSSFSLLVICMAFTLWCIFDISSWFAFMGSANTMFVWSLLDLISLVMFFFSYYFLYTFITKKDLPVWQEVLSIILILPTAVWTYLGSNLVSYDSNNCAAIENTHITSYLFIVQALFIFASLIFAITQYVKSKGNSKKRREIFSVGSGIILFLVFFFSASLLVSLLASGDASLYVYNYEIYGLFGMPVLLVYLGYLIVRQHAFDIKAFGAQALIIALIALIGSEFFYLQSTPAIIITAITLVITGIIGINLMRSVKKEIRLREEIEKQEKQLEIANTKLKELDQLKSEFVSLATHQIRAPLSAIKGYLSEVFEGDYGHYPKELEKPLRVVYDSTENLVNIVGDFLNISRIESGNMKYELASVDMKQVVTDSIKTLNPNIERAGLELKVEIPEGTFGVYADIGKVKQVIGNLIDNSIKYTPKGSLKVSLSKNEKTQKVLFELTDTGIGIPPEVLPKLFQKFTRAKDANEVNIIGTGLGLYVAKMMIEGQKGRVWATSPGKGRGSSFFVELPVAHVS